MSKKKKWLIGIGLTLVIIILIALNVGSKETKSIEIQTEAVKSGTIVKTVSASGKIQPVSDVKISSNVSAKIIKLHVEEGDQVKRGQLLVTLDRTNYEAGVNQARAELLRSKAQLAQSRANHQKAKQDYERIKGLYDKKLSSVQELEAAANVLATTEASITASESQIDAADAVLEQNMDNLAKTKIYTPISGTVSKLNKEEGEIALGSTFSQDVVMIIANLSKMEARVNVDENDIVAISIGDSALIEVDALPGERIKGFVTDIANSATIRMEGTTEEKAEFEIKVAITDAVKTLRPGMSADADVTTDTKANVLSVPIQSVTVRKPDVLKRKKTAEGEVLADTVSTEYVANKDGVVEVVFVVENGNAIARPVKTGIQSESHIEIIEGLLENQTIVVGPYRAISKDLENGSAVKVDNSGGEKKRDKRE